MKCCHLVPLVLLAGTLALAAGGDQPALSTPAPAHLGIAVIGPAVYDYEALRAVLESLVAELAGSGTALNVAAVKAALGNVQGATATERYLSTRLNIAPPTPQIITKQETTVAPPSDGGSSSTTTQKTTTDQSSAPATAVTAPELPDLTTPETTQLAAMQKPIMAPDKLGFGAQDVLAEQLELSRQLALLRLVMDESHSDRFRVTAEGKDQIAGFRAKTVLGFQISIDAAPPNAAADVQLTVTAVRPADEMTGPRLSVIRILPEDKTYNASMLTSSRRDFGLGATVEFVGLGVLSGKRQSAMYLVRDTDTVALLYPAPQGRKRAAASFGWQFRPVLGRKTVTPGKRDVYVALALPEASKDDCLLKVTGTICWRRFNAKTKVLGEIIGLPQDLDIAKAVVPARSKLVSTRNPSCSGAVITPAAAGQAMVVLEGKQLDQNTSVLAGGRIIREPELIRTSDARIAFSAPVADLAACPVRLATPYGSVVPLYERTDGDRPNYEVAEGSVTVTPRDAANARVALTVKPVKGAWDGDEICFPWAVSVGSKLFALDKLAASGSAAGAALSFVCDMQTLRDSPALCVSRLAIGDVCHAESDIPPQSRWQWDAAPLGLTDISIVTEEATYTRYVLTGLGFASDMKVFVGGVSATLEECSSRSALVSVPRATALRAQKVMVSRDGHAPATLSLAQTPLPAPVPAITVADAEQHAIGPVAVEGRNLDLIKEVKFGDKALTLFQDAEGKWWLYLLKEVTENVGLQPLLVSTEKAKSVTAVRVKEKKQ